jgi:hypothetical protein
MVMGLRRVLLQRVSEGCAGTTLSMRNESTIAVSLQWSASREGLIRDRVFAAEFIGRWPVLTVNHC